MTACVRIMPAARVLADLGWPGVQVARHGGEFELHPNMEPITWALVMCAPRPATAPPPPHQRQAGMNQQCQEELYPIQ